MRSHARFSVRQARAEDFDAIVALEKARFGAVGTDCYLDDHVEAWYETCPEGLVVAELGGRVVAHHYAQRWDFSFGRVARLTTHDAETDNGLSRATHCPGGNAWYGISLCSIARGAGPAVLERIFADMPAHGVRYFVGAARITGFDPYVRSLEQAGVAWRAQASQDDLALWYAYGCAALTASKIWPTMRARPNLSLPVPAEIDPVLNRHIALPGYGPAALLPGYMHDPPSRDYGVFVVFDAEPSS